MNGFTKLYKEERELLRKINTGAAYEVYMHLKDKYRYYNKDVYSYMKCIAEYLEMSEITVKRTIKKLKEVGLIECRREWTKDKGVPKCSNYYSFPIVDMIEKSEYKKEETIETHNVDNILSTDAETILKEYKGVIDRNINIVVDYRIKPTQLGAMKMKSAMETLEDIASKCDGLMDYINRTINEKQYNKQYGC